MDLHSIAIHGILFMLLVWLVGRVSREKEGNLLLSPFSLLCQNQKGIICLVTLMACE